jgi:Fe-S-cluster containining protein
MSLPWYQDGLQFQCTRCGGCCTGEPGFVLVSDDELAAVAAFRREALVETTGLCTRLTPKGRILREQPNGDCIFFNRTAGCTIYSLRPRQCRTWPFWASNLRTPQAWQQTCRVCPGSGRGELISVAEIARRLNLIRL